MELNLPQSSFRQRAQRGSLHNRVSSSLALRVLSCFHLFSWLVLIIDDDKDNDNSGRGCGKLKLAIRFAPARPWRGWELGRNDIPSSDGVMPISAPEFWPIRTSASPKLGGMTA